MNVSEKWPKPIPTVLLGSISRENPKVSVLRLFCIQRRGIRFKPGYKQAGISQILYPLGVGIKAVITLPRAQQNSTKMFILLIFSCSFAKYYILLLFMSHSL